VLIVLFIALYYYQDFFDKLSGKLGGCHFVDEEPSRKEQSDAEQKQSQVGINGRVYRAGKSAHRFKIQSLKTLEYCWK